MSPQKTEGGLGESYKKKDRGNYLKTKGYQGGNLFYSCPGARSFLTQSVFFFLHFISSSLLIKERCLVLLTPGWAGFSSTSVQADWQICTRAFAGG